MKFIKGKKFRLLAAGVYGVVYYDLHPITENMSINKKSVIKFLPHVHGKKEIEFGSKLLEIDPNGDHHCRIIDHGEYTSKGFTVKDIREQSSSGGANFEPIDYWIQYEYGGVPIFNCKINDSQRASLIEFILKMNQSGIMHNDISNVNVVILDGIARLIDFGCAKFCNREDDLSALFK